MRQSLFTLAPLSDSTMSAVTMSALSLASRESLLGQAEDLGDAAELEENVPVPDNLGLAQRPRVQGAQRLPVTQQGLTQAGGRRIRQTSSSSSKETAANRTPQGGAQRSLWGALNASPPPRQQQTAVGVGEETNAGGAAEDRGERGALAAEVARLRVQSAALAAENDQLRHQANAAEKDAEQARRASEAQASEAATYDGVAVEAAANAGRLAAAEAREARLRERTTRQKRALGKLAAAAADVAGEHDRVAKELVLAKQAALEANERAGRLERRLNAVQELYLNQGAAAASGGGGGAHAIGDGVVVRDSLATPDAALADPALERALHLLTPELLAASAPPADFPSRPSDLGAMPLKQRNGAATDAPTAVLRRREKQLIMALKEKEKEVRTLQEQVAVLERDRERAHSATTRGVRERRELETTYTTRLAGAARRIRWLLERETSWRAGLKRAEEYGWQLERRLLHITQQNHERRSTKQAATDAGTKAEPAVVPAKKVLVESPSHADEAGRESAQQVADTTDTTSEKELVLNLKNSLEALDAAVAAADARTPQRDGTDPDPFGTPHPEIDVVAAEQKAARGAEEDAEATRNDGDGVREADDLVDRLRRCLE